MIRSLLAGALLLASPARAQSITGVVRDTSCTVLPGAEVVLKGDSTERQAITDVHGEFAFRDLSERRYGLTIRLNGFYAFRRDDVLPSQQASASFEIRLPLGPLVMIERVGRVLDVPGSNAADGSRVHVVDQNCQPLRGARLELRDTAVTRLAVDDSGWVSIPAGARGDFELRVSAPEFIPVSIPSLAAPFKFGLPLTVALRRGQSDIADILDSQPSVPSKIRIVAMGDSTTAGTPAFQSPREAPPNGRGDQTSQYAYWLMHAHSGWEVVNQGINGQRSDQIRARFEEDVLATKPAVVVIIAGVNDVYQGWPAQHVKDELAAMYRRAHEARISVVAGTILPYNTATPKQNLAMHDINDWISRQARADPRVIYVDTRAAVASPHDPDRLFSSPDGLHPDAAGYRRMANTIEAAIEQALNGARQ